MPSLGRGSGDVSAKTCWWSSGNRLGFFTRLAPLATDYSPKLRPCEHDTSRGQQQRCRRRFGDRRIGDVADELLSHRRGMNGVPEKVTLAAQDTVSKRRVGDVGESVS